ncbi:M23 family metallopeptidase [Paenibacillus sp. GSMTC-2017]|uniref:M23 family metallopeptidase n=1 Tax=Paenibacillus sp. GSMTC-2017 TaxID=2794350 RepID=UPI0018DA3615|nr:M23 family metallopeptidase [Paenibacillus sp. GSMTC-2017]MBH5317151.1 M23 family metallopeptidase [Paenibacillus sp. GSMTC-2017]
MGLIDDVRQRRHDKIRSLLDQYNSSKVANESFEQLGKPDELPSKNGEDQFYEEPFRSLPTQVPTVPVRNSFVYNEDSSPDPELTWKRNPNPWAAWDDEKVIKASQGRFVKSAPKFHKREDPPTSYWRRLRKELIWKSVISVILFGCVWAMFQYNETWTVKGQFFVKQALTDEIDFASAALWYKEVFAGAPSFIPIFGEESGDATLVDGTIKAATLSPLLDASIIRSFADLLSGVELAGISEEQVVAVETGRVIQVSEQQDSILIQHANNRITIYGKLGSAKVAVNDWVVAGDAIGHLKKAKEGEPSLLYFAIKQNDRYLDPLDVIPLD